MKMVTKGVLPLLAVLALLTSCQTQKEAAIEELDQETAFLKNDLTARENELDRPLYQMEELKKLQSAGRKK